MATFEGFVQILPTGTTVSAIAHACRNAALDFFEGSRGTWTKRELAAWLVQSYKPLLVRDEVRRSQPPLPLARTRVDDVMVAARGRALEWLRDPEGLGEWAILRGLVIPCVDETGTPGFAPVGWSRMHLSERVLSITAVDVLVHAEDWQNDLFLCSDCELVAMGAPAGTCPDCEARSGSRVRMSTTVFDVLAAHR